jgi:hypothetical protein
MPCSHLGTDVVANAIKAMKATTAMKTLKGKPAMKPKGSQGSILWYSDCISLWVAIPFFYFVYHLSRRWVSHPVLPRTL